MSEEVVLVNGEDEEVGTEEKIRAHEEGKLHRAFSIFVFNDEDELLLQKRAEGKYHCGGLWTNTCCSHPRPSESLEEAIHRRIEEEMGFDCPLEEVFSFVYRSEFDSGLTEHEIDHVFMGKFNGSPDPNLDEVGDWKWIPPEDLKKDLNKHPEKYTPWFRKCVDRTIDHLKK